MMNKLLIILILLPISCTTSKRSSSLSSPTNTEQVVVTPHLLFHTEVSSQWVIDTVRVANCVWQLPEYQEKIKSKEAYDYTDDSGEMVVSTISKKSCGVRTYRTKNPWSSVIATTYLSDRNYLYLNTRMVGGLTPIKERVNTLIHECSHLAGYTHGDNSPIGKENSVPYGIGNKAEEFVAKCN